MQLEKIQTTEETMWAQRARIKWLKKGHRNTIFFHHTANKRSKNHISLLEVDGEELSNRNDISSAFSNFFCERMGTTTPFLDIRVNWEKY